MGGGVIFRLTKMKIRRLKIENFRGIVDETIDFDPSFTVFAGRNGGGKSTILEAIAIMLSRLSGRMSGNAGDCASLGGRDITYGKKSCLLRLTLSSPEDSITLSLGLDSDGNEMEDSAAADACAAKLRGVFSKVGDPDCELPVFAYYGSDRNTSGFCAPRPSEGMDRMSVYNNAFSAGTNFDGFAEWFAAVLLERELAVSEAARMPLKRGNRAREEIEKKYRFISEIKGALREFSPTLEGFYVEDGRLFVKPRGIPAEYLSQGEKSVAALISDIALRMSGANPAMKKPLSTDAIIMIDEVDLHLHPDWQAQIAVKLQKIFPNAQFIVSSHSPSVFSVVKSVYKLDEDGDGTMRLARSSQYGKAPADILGTFLNAGREGSVKAEIDAMYEALDAGDAGRAMKAIARLRRIIPDDPEVLRGEYLARAIGSSNVNGGTNAPH